MWTLDKLIAQAVPMADYANAISAGLTASSASALAK